jgi:uncharacterized protein
MAELNKDVLKRANAAMVAGDYEGFLKHCTDDVVWTFVGDRTLRGKAAVRAYIRATYDGPPTFSVEHLIADADFVTALGTIDLKDDKGRVVQWDYCDVWRVRDGKLAELKAFVIEPKSGA